MPVNPADSVQVAVRSGDAVAYHNALVLAVDANPGMAGANNEPAIEAVYVDTSALHHAGSPSWELAMKRVSALHWSHEAVKDGKVTVSYTSAYEVAPVALPDEPAIVEPSAADLNAFLSKVPVLNPAAVADETDRHEELAAETADLATLKAEAPADTPLAETLPAAE